jgi:phosphatidylserine/phosphatidylglycerophosphate/cardiolipin synthase-like enzyme
MSLTYEVDQASVLAARPPTGNFQSPAAVRWLQAALNIALPAALAVDGIAGGQTRGAVSQFQGQRGLVVDGIAGPQTFGALVRALDAMAAGSAAGGTASLALGAGACAALAEPVVLDDFDFDRATLKPLHHDRLAKVALCLRASPGLRRVRIVGHTDPEGDPAYNEGLGRRRAEETRRGLQSAMARVLPGLERAVVVDVESLGERDPASVKPAENRRVQLFLGRTVTPVKPKPKPTPTPPPPPPPRPAMSALTRLRRRYFDPGLPTFVENTTAAPIIDGAGYMAAVERAISRTKGEGDVILIAGWTFDPAMDLGGRLRGTPGFKEVGQLLAEKAALGVTVRVVLNGSIVAQLVPGVPATASFVASFAALLDLRTRLVGTASPLADSVVWDFSGAPDGSHHMKSVVVKAGDDVVAFVGGMDLDPGRFDVRTHDLPGKVWIDGSRWGWHDAAVRLKGEGTKAVWATLHSRWEEARTLPPAMFLDTRRFPPTLQRFNPPTLGAAPAVPGSVPPSRSPGTGLQVLVSRWEEKRPGQPWAGTPSGAIRDVHRAMVAAIRGAQRYIYIEDQFLDNSMMLPRSSAARTSLFPELGAAVARGVRLILVSSDKVDPTDVPSAGPISLRVRSGLVNRTLTSAVTRDIIRAPGADPANVAVWRLEDVTVHAKLMIIDDVFAAIGSANLHTRSMAGVDDELHTFVVDSANRVRSLRMDLWAEHLRIALAGRPASVDAALANLGTALGMWRRPWLVGGSPGMWFASGNPAGFAPRELKRVFVGPTPGP